MTSALDGVSGQRHTAAAPPGHNSQKTTVVCVIFLSIHMNAEYLEIRVHFLFWDAGLLIVLSWGYAGC
jgi:hypothetical protein